MRATRVGIPASVSLALAVAFTALLPGSPAGAASTPDIPFEKYQLGNGLEVILHPDSTVPTVHVEVWYKVGSKDEEPGRTGFAHLFEHMMFQGTKHIPEDAYFKYLAEAGASNRNGSTSNDLTNYFETVPSNQLELGLWLESSRMGFLLERPSFKSTFENQRDVVKNERRQRIENAPMGGIWKVRSEALFPPNHPYYHEVIGSMSDLDSATETDIKNFFTRYYAPNNAMLLVAGDFEVAKTKGLIEKYFGPIPQGPPIKRIPFPPASLAAEKRIAMEAKVNLPTETITWHTVAGFAPGDAEMDLVGEILGGGKTSRLYKRLVYDMKIAQSVRASNSGQLHAGEFTISFTPLQGHTVAEIEKVIDEELEKIRTQPVEPRELERVKNQTRAGFFRSLEP
ncbi:MAG TPA: pitrilysin family protein, partial [Polyangia bacterium]|nr:pitrilysin family protein [Polyangia bacterium]